MKDELARALRTTHQIYQRRREAENALREAVRQGTLEDVVRRAKALFVSETEREGDERASDRTPTSQ